MKRLHAASIWGTLWALLWVAGAGCSAGARPPGAATRGAAGGIAVSHSAIDRPCQIDADCNDGQVCTGDGICVDEVTCPHRTCRFDSNCCPGFTCQSRLCKAVPSDVLACDGTLYYVDPQLADHLALPANIEVMNPASAATTPFAAAGIEVDALGFNPVDGHLYAISNDNTGRITAHHLIRVGRLAMVEDLGAIAAFDGKERFAAGTFLADGSYLVATPTAAVSGQNFWARVDVQARAVVTSGNLIGGEDVDFSDWAVNPRDGHVYFYDQAGQRLGTFDPATGNVADFGPMTVALKLASASAFTSAGAFLLYASPDLRSKLLYRFDLSTSVATVLAGPGVFPIAPGGDDLASCPFGGTSAAPIRQRPARR